MIRTCRRNSRRNSEKELPEGILAPLLMETLWMEGTMFEGRLENIRPQVAIDELWHAAGEGRIKATALEYENVKAFVGRMPANRSKSPPSHWAYLKRRRSVDRKGDTARRQEAGSTGRFSFADWTSKNFGQSHRR